MRKIISVCISIVMVITAFFLMPNMAQSQYDETYRELDSELKELDSKIFIPEGKVNHMKILDKRWDEYMITVDQKEYELHEPYQRDRYDEDHHDDSYIPEEEMSLAEVIYNAIRVNDTIKIYESGRLIINGKAEYEPNYDHPKEMAVEEKDETFVAGWGITLGLAIILTSTSLFWEKLGGICNAYERSSEEDLEERATRLVQPD